MRSKSILKTIKCRSDKTKNKKLYKKQYGEAFAMTIEDAFRAEKSMETRVMKIQIQ